MKYLVHLCLIFVAFYGNAQQSKQKDKYEILQKREVTNRAIKNYDIISETNCYMDEYIIILGSGGLISGKQKYIERYKNDTIGYYVRKPITVKVSKSDTLAIENGQWVYIDKGIQQLGGDYTAQWRKILDVWKIQGEVYVQLWHKEHDK